MSYNEIPNSLVDSVVLPNKLLSSLEVIDTVTFFTRHIFYQKKLNEFGILYLGLSSGDGTHWVMWFKKVRTSSISIVMVCRLLVR